MVQATAGSGTLEVAPGGEPLFNVDVKMRANTTLEDVDRQARAAGILPERVDALLKALRNAPQIRIGTNVPRSRADAAKAQFDKAGLVVEITPVLVLQGKYEVVADEKIECPACEQRVVLGPQRQCPECGVFVDKVTPEDVMRRKLLRQERAKLEFQIARDAKDADKKTRTALEDALRAKIREELEEEYGLKEKRSALASPPVLAAVALVLAGAAFVGGRGSLGSWPWERETSAAVANKQADPDKLLEPMGAKGAADVPAGGTAVTDPDLDDPLLRQAAGKGTGGKGLTVEQAVAAAQVLGKSVGARVPIEPGAAGAAGGAGTAGASVAAGTAAQAPAAGDVAPAPVAPGLKTALALEFAQQMAEMGQWSRAQALVGALRSSSRTASDPALAAAAQEADVEVRAWALQGVAPGQSRVAAESLLAQARALPTPARQTQGLGLAASILSRQVSLPEEVPRAFLQQGVEAAKRIEVPADRVTAVSELNVSVGQSLLAEATRATRAGAWSRAQGIATRLESLLGQTSDPAVQARLLAMDSQLKAQQGKADLSAQSLARSLDALERIDNLAQRAVLLQQVARLLDPSSQAAIATSAASLQAQALTRTGVERARALAELAVLYAQSGQAAKAAEAAAAAGATEGVAEADAVALQARLIVRRELATARLLHDTGRYAESEAALRRVGDFLL